MDVYGSYYYEDTINDTVTWMAPVGEEYAQWVDIEAEHRSLIGYKIINSKINVF